MSKIILPASVEADVYGDAADQIVETLNSVLQHCIDEYQKKRSVVLTAEIKEHVRGAAGSAIPELMERYGDALVAGEKLRFYGAWVEAVNVILDTVCKDFLTKRYTLQ